MWTSENNWYKWYYGNEPVFGRQTSELPFCTSYSCGFNGVVGNFKEELLNAAASTLDHYPGLKPCVFFSGGADSELILRAYLEIGSNPEVYIIRYEKDYNMYYLAYIKMYGKSMKPTTEFFNNREFIDTMIYLKYDTQLEKYYYHTFYLFQILTKVFMLKMKQLANYLVSTLMEHQNKLVSSKNWDI